MPNACPTFHILVYVHVRLQVEFERPVDAKGNIEVWLQRLVDGMQDTVKQVSMTQNSHVRVQLQV